MNVYSWPAAGHDFRKPCLTSIKLCTLLLKSPIQLLYRYISFSPPFFFFPILLSELLTCWLFCLSLCSTSFSHIRMARPRLRETQFGGRNGGLERLFNLGQTCAVPRSLTPHQWQPYTPTHPSILPSVYLRWSFKCLKLMDSMSAFLPPPPSLSLSSFLTWGR